MLGALKTTLHRLDTNPTFRAAALRTNLGGRNILRDDLSLWQKKQKHEIDKN